MAMKSVFNPSLPCTLDLNGMFDGKTIYIFGKAKPNANRFHINFSTAEGDIALHFNPRFPGQKVVRNTKQGAAWGSEERDGDFPFQAGQTFGIKFTCRKDHFEIQANRYKTYATYVHRVPISSITKLQIAGDCEVKVVSSGINGLEVPVQVLTGLPSPLNLDIPFHNIRDHSVTFIGKPTSSSGRFHIDLLSADGTRRHLHFNPRMGDKQIVRNTFDGSWGKEERGLTIPFPFENGVPFQLKISATRTHFDVEVNGTKLLEYRKRIAALKNIGKISVNGDVNIEKMICV